MLNSVDKTTETYLFCMS